MQIGAQFGTIVSMPLSGLLSEYGFDGGWPSIFYVFGFVGVIWSVAFLFFVYEDPSSHPHIDEKEKKYIVSSLWGASTVTVSYPVCCVFFRKLSPSISFFFLLRISVVTASAILENNEIPTILRHFIRTHGPKLWLRNVDDRAANLYETSASLFHQRSESNQKFRNGLRN